MVINFIFILWNFAYICSDWPKIEKETEYYLTKYRNIQIKEFNIEIFNYFEVSQKQYISNNLKYLEYDYSEYDSKIFREINDFREKNNLTKFTIKYNLPDFIINEISEIFLFKSQHLFKLGKNKYLFKYELGKFDYYFLSNNKELINMLLKKDLNTINIIEKRKYTIYFII